MATYDVLVSKGLLAEFHNGNLAIPNGFRITGQLGADGPSTVRVRVEDDNAPSWTDGKLVEVTFTNDYDDEGSVTTRVSSYREVTR